MDIIEKVDIPKDIKSNPDIYQNSFILPSQSIINFDLTPLKFTDTSNENNSIESERVPSLVENSIDFNKDDDMMMKHHATLTSSNEKASNSIWLPAHKHPQISPNGYNDWIKIRTNDKHNSGVTVSRKKSVLSTLSFNTTNDDINSNGSSTSDEDEELITPTASTLPSLPDSFTDNLKEKHLIKEAEEEAHEEKNTNALLCRQANYATTYDAEQEKSLNLLSIQTNNLQQQPLAVTQNVKERTIQHSSINMPQVVTRSPDLLNADHHSKKDRKSWFSGLLHDLKKTSKPQKPKKTGLTSLFSRPSERLEPTANTKSSNTVKTQQYPSLSPTKPKKKKSESAVSKNGGNLPIQRDNEPLPQRYSLNTERAIYRISHVKLGNPRRPLQHQVVISNMMYWYLSIQQQQEQQQQQQQQQQQNYYHNKRQQVYFNNIYQATYQSFEPPTPGGGDHQHQPHFHSHPNTHHQQQNSYYVNPSVQQMPSQQLNENYTPFITEKPKNSNTNQSKKKKYKPVLNNQYDPLIFENIIGAHNFQ